MVWYFIGVHIINRTLHGRLEILNLSSHADKILCHSFAGLTCEIFFNTQREISFPRGHVISSISAYNVYIFTFPYVNYTGMICSTGYAFFQLLVTNRASNVTPTEISKKILKQTQVFNFFFFFRPRMVSICPHKIIYLKQHLASNSIEFKIMRSGHCKQQTKAPKPEQTSEIHFHLHFQEITSQHF